MPPKDHDLIGCFLNDDDFLSYSWHQYNALGLGLTQLYNRIIVLNHKRHGIFKLGSKEFDFRRPSKGFPNKLTAEFLLVDLVNNLDELAEDISDIKERIRKNIFRFDWFKVSEFSKKYGKIDTKLFFDNIDR